MYFQKIHQLLCSIKTHLLLTLWIKTTFKTTKTKDKKTKKCKQPSPYCSLLSRTLAVARH